MSIIVGTTEITKTVKSIVFYRWHCPGCNMEMSNMHEPEQSGLLCMPCDFKDSEMRKGESEQRFIAHYGYLYGSSIVSVAPNMDYWWDCDIVDIESMLIIGSDGKQYKIKADSDLWISEVK